MYRKKNNQNPYMINKNQRNKMVTLLESLKLASLVQLVQLVYLYFLKILINHKVTILHLWFLFIMYGFGYLYFYTKRVLIMIFSISILMHFTDNIWFDPPHPHPRRVLLNKLDQGCPFATFEIGKQTTFA